MSLMEIDLGTIIAALITAIPPMLLIYITHKNTQRTVLAVKESIDKVEVHTNGMSKRLEELATGKGLAEGKLAGMAEGLEAGIKQGEDVAAALAKETSNGGT